MILELEVFIWDENNQKLLDIGEEPNGAIEEEGSIVYITFYNIDFIHQYKDFYCVIGSGGEVFTINEEYSVLKDKIKEQLHFKFN